jgi:hypothetical protein
MQGKGEGASPQGQGEGVKGKGETFIYLFPSFALQSFPPLPERERGWGEGDLSFVTQPSIGVPKNFS